MSCLKNMGAEDKGCLVSLDIFGHSLEEICI